MNVGSKPLRKPKPLSVCPRCQGFMERRMAIREGVNTRFWGDDKPHLNIGGVEIHHYMCIKCGNVSSYQLDTRIKLVSRPR